MGLDDRPHRQPSSAHLHPSTHHQHPHPLPPSTAAKTKPPNHKKESKYHTADYKKPPKSSQVHDTKYATAPANLDKASSNLDKKILVSLISQSEYMKRHLYIKTGVDHERSVLRYQLKKVSIRNYTPKAINQDINMGMWI